jgi:predicted  nucleic acid-binding Zn-ribbon protein
MAKTTAKSTLPNGHDWSRWRGEVDTRLNYLCDTQKDQQAALVRVENTLQELLQRFEEKQEKIREALDTRVSNLESFSLSVKTTVALVSALAGVLGGGVGVVIFNYVIKTLLGWK